MEVAMIKNTWTSTLSQYMKKHMSDLEETRMTLTQGISSVLTKTDGINNNSWSILNTNFNVRFEDCFLIKLTPCMPKLMCHHNCLWLSKQNANIKSVIGFNITANKEDGKFVSMELHSVSWYEGQYYDLTTDFGGETSKWFVPICQIRTATDVMVMKHILANLGFIDGYIFSTRKHHTRDGFTYKEVTGQTIFKCEKLIDVLLASINKF